MFDCGVRLKRIGIQVNYLHITNIREISMHDILHMLLNAIRQYGCRTTITF